MKLTLLILFLTSGLTDAWVTTSFCREQVHHRSSVLSVDDSNNVEASKNKLIIISKPEIQWTVPGMKRGWQEEDGNWWDEDGIRQGPPMNYWRQRADERAYKKDMAVLEAVLEATSVAEVDMSSLSLQLVSPLLNNKLLGVWAPIVLNGQKVGGKSRSTDLLEAPYTISIARPGLRQLGPTTGYGTFDAHFQPGEDVSVTVRDSTFTLTASKENCFQQMGLINDEEPLAIGNISYLSEYLLIMKNQDGTLREFWARAEPIRSVSKEEAAKIRNEFEVAQAADEKVEAPVAVMAAV